MKKIKINKNIYIWLLGMNMLLSIMTIAAMWISVANSSYSNSGMTALGHTFAGLLACSLIAQLVISILDENRKNWVQVITFAIVLAIHILLWILNGLWLLEFTGPALHTVLYVVIMAACLYFFISDYFGKKTQEEKIKDKDTVATSNAIIKQEDHETTFIPTPDVVTEPIKQESNDEGTK